MRFNCYYYVWVVIVLNEPLCMAVEINIAFNCLSLHFVAHMYLYY